MPNNNTTTHKLEKGDVIWVPYRRDPLWPALVQSVYPKKVTYCFFPLPSEKEMRKNRFSCSPKLTYALIPSETLPKEADAKLIAAFRAASSYLNSMGKARGADIESIDEAEAREEANGEFVESKRRLGGGGGGSKRRMSERTDYDDQYDDPPPQEGLFDLFELREVKQEPLDEQPPPKKCASASSSSDSPSPSRAQPPVVIINEEHSKEMMGLIDTRLKTIFDKIWNSDTVKKCKVEEMKGELKLQLRNDQFLTKPDYETLFERVISLIRAQSPPPSLLVSINIASSVIVPDLLINCYAEWKNVDLETAKEAFYQKKNNRVLGLDPTMSIPVTDHLEQLCRLACNESDAIQQ